MPKVNYKIGFHAGIGGGLKNALLRSAELGCNTVQIFSRNPRGWLAKPLTRKDIATFQGVRAKTKIGPVAIHANYLINLAAANDEMRGKSLASFREEVERGIALKADYLVVHPGSAKDSSEEGAIRTCADTIRAACDGLDLGNFRILLENTAGQGACIGHRFEHLRDIMAACPELDLGVCLDTAHAFTAGYDLRDPDGFSEAMQSLNKNVGLKRVRVVHFNDSKAAYNSRVDRHWHIGLGHIGAEGLRRVASYSKLRHAAFILETPQEDWGLHVKNLNTLRSFVAAALLIVGRENLMFKKVSLAIMVLLGLSAAIAAQEMRDASNRTVGYVKSSGEVANASNRTIGYFKSGGEVADASNRTIGYIKSSGEVADGSNRTVGYIKRNGEIADASNRTIGYVKSSGEVADASNRTVGYARGVSEAQTAAFFFFFFKPE